MAKLKSTMFREYDVRGLVNDKELNEDSVSYIAKAYGTMLRKQDIAEAVVGYDLREKSPEMAAVAIDALLSTGINVISIGQVLTPIMYHAQYHYQSKGGMMITASHNPSGWLGFKLAMGYSYTFGPSEIRKLQNLTKSEDFSTGQGTLREEDYIPIYAEDVVNRVKIGQKTKSTFQLVQSAGDQPGYHVNVQPRIKVLINAGNGTAGPIMPNILRKAGCEVAEFLTEPDLAFKHYFPNPSLKEMMDETALETMKANADIGFAIDGDGDRLGITDEKGNIVWPDRYLALLARSVLKETPGAHIVFDAKCSRALIEDIEAHGGIAYMWLTGHSYIKQKMHELGAPLAGEMSGHIFVGKPIYYGFDDAVFTALKLAEMLSTTSKTFSELIAETPTYVSTPTLQTHCDDEIKYDVVQQLVEEFQAKKFNVRIFADDPKFGARVEFEDGWGLVRASSNLPVLVMRFEATTDERLAEIQQMFREKFKEYPNISEQWENG